MYALFSILMLVASLLLPFEKGKDAYSEQLKEAVETILMDRYPHRQDNLHVRVVRTGGVINLDSPFEIFLPETSEVPRALQRIEVQNTSQHKKGWALIFVAHYDSVLTVTRAIKNDERLAADEIHTIWAETTRFHGEPLTPASLRNLIARGEVFANRYVSADRILKHDDLRNAFDISTGQSVILRYQRRGVALSLTCKARNKGFTGDLVKLYSPDTQLMYRARIIGPGVATWVETLE